jgi:hypothetical protein
MLKVYPKKKEYIPLLEHISTKPIIPDWYKNQKMSSDKDTWNKFINKKPAKNCPALQHNITSSYYVTAWSDVYVEIFDDGSSTWDCPVRFAWEEPIEDWIRHQSPNQLEGMDIKQIPGVGILKLVMPMYFKTPKGYGLLVEGIHPTAKFVQGISPTDKWFKIPLPFSFEGNKLVIKTGEPLVKLTIVKLKPKIQKINTIPKYFNVLEIKKNQVYHWNRYKNM